jgi:hypothetical protein
MQWRVYYNPLRAWLKKEARARKRFVLWGGVCWSTYTQHSSLLRGEKWYLLQRFFL